MFNKVVRWHRLSEVENVYVAYNFSHFAIFLPKFIKIGGKFSQNKNAPSFLNTVYKYNENEKSSLTKP